MCDISDIRQIRYGHQDVTEIYYVEEEYGDYEELADTDYGDSESEFDRWECTNCGNEYHDWARCKAHLSETLVRVAPASTTDTSNLEALEKLYGK